MYDDLTVQMIQDELLAAVSADMDIRPSSLIYTVCAAAALQFAQLYVNLDYVNDQSYASTADREHLLLIAKEAAMAPKDATATTVKAKFNIELQLGTRFTAINVPYKFYITTPCELDSDGFYYAQMDCETAGDLPDTEFVGPCVPVDVAGDVIEIDGLTTAEIVSIITPGEDEEDTEAFRKRYFTESQWEHYGGNIADYEVMMSRQMGVGACKVIPVWNGGGTVKLVLVDPEFKPCSQEFIKQVQESVDPPGLEGDGYGKAPIDHAVTVVSADKTVINVGFTLTYDDGQSWATVETNVKAAIEAYFDKVRRQWKDLDTLIIRIAHIESAILDVPGVVDIKGTTLNSGADNVSVTAYNVPLLGTVTPS